MEASNPGNIAGAIFNYQRDPSHGRVDFVCRQFDVSRSDFYRKKNGFDMLFGRPGRPSLDARQAEARKLEEDLRRERMQNELLQAQLKQEKSMRETAMKRMIFLLIAIGLSTRLIAWTIQQAFRKTISHTSVAQQARSHAIRATRLMQEHFHSRARTAAVDEVFVEGRPVLVAVAPRSLLISNCAVKEQRTEEEWTAFLDKMENLDSTVSDRGTAILAAVAKRKGHIHQSDHFHCMFTINKELKKMEAGCYRLIREEEDAKMKLKKRKTSGRDARKAAATLRRASERCTAALELFDNLEQAITLAFDALNLSCGIRLNSHAQATETLDFACEWITHLHPSWKKVVNALKDPDLLTHLLSACRRLEDLDVQSDPADREYILAALTFFWEQQASRRWRGKPLLIPQSVLDDLTASCRNLDHVCEELFEILEDVPRASSAVECINSRIGFFRYSKRRFNDDFANFICVIHNLTPFQDGKRKGKSPAEIENVPLPTTDLFELFDVA